MLNRTEGRNHLVFNVNNGPRGLNHYSRSRRRRLPTDEWVHVAATYDGCRRLWQHVNGIYDGRGRGRFRSPIGYDHETKLLLNEPRSSNNFSGQMDEVRIWNRARTKVEIYEDMHYRLTGYEPGLVANWQFDEGSGDVLHDRTEFANHGKLIGAPEWVPSSAPIGDRSGIRRNSFMISKGNMTLFPKQPEDIISTPTPWKALSFTKRNDIMTLDNPIKLSSSWTIEAWFRYPFPNSSDFAVLARGENKYFQIIIQDGMLGNFYGGTGLSGCGFEMSNLKEGWHHIAVVGREGATSFLIDGEFVGEVFAETSSNICAIGNHEYGLYSFSPIAELRVWHCARSVEEIEANMKVRLTGSEPNLEAYWTFEEESGKVVYDLTSNGHHGKLHGDIQRIESAVIPEKGDNNLKSTECTIESGFSSILYNQQESEATGYDRQEKPIKRGSRVMLAAVTGTKNYGTVVSVIDFALSRDGQLAQIPDVIALPTVGENDDDRSLRLLHMDNFGLTVNGGILGFARTNNTPLLTESATGKLGLYFKGENDQFCAAYYDLKTKKARFSVETEEDGSVIFIARSTEQEMDDLAIEVTDGTSTDKCNVTIKNSTTGIEEKWNDVPRDARNFASVFNGTTEEEAVNYDYDKLSESNWVRSFNGSLQCVVTTLEATGNVENGEAKIESKTDHCKWVPEIPGKALKFDGKDDYVELKPPIGWNDEVSPEPKHHSLLFDGSNDYVRLPEMNLNFENGYTIEMWLKSETPQWWVHILDFGRGYETDNIEIVNWKYDTSLTVYHYHSYEVVNSQSGCDFTPGEWFHVALVNYADGKFLMYKNGRRVQSGRGRKLDNVPRHRNYIGLSNRDVDRNGNVVPVSDRYDNLFRGKMDELRIWSCPRSPDEIELDMNSRLSGKESGLSGYWRFEPHGAIDYSGNGNHGKYKGNPQLADHAPSVKAPDVPVERKIQFPELKNLQSDDGDLTIETWIHPTSVGDRGRLIHYCSKEMKYTLGVGQELDSDSSYHVFAGVGNRFKRSKQAISDENWEHLALTYNQSYALQFKGDDILRSNHNTSLDIVRDLTIEVFVKIDDFSKPHGLVSKGRLDDGTSQAVSYSLWIDTNRRVLFAYEDTDGQSDVFNSDLSIRSGVLQKISVVRQRQVSVPTKDNHEVRQWFDIRFFIDGIDSGNHMYYGNEAGINELPLEIGKAYRDGQEYHLTGSISEIRLWNRALSSENMGTRIQGSKSGLVSYWQFEEKEGNVAHDKVGSNDAFIKGAKWVKSPDESASMFVLYHNGSSTELEDMSDKPDWGEEQFTLGAMKNRGVKECYSGTMEEVRIWKVVRTQEQIQDNLFCRLKNEKEDLLANYSFDLDSELELTDSSLLGNDLIVGTGDNKPEVVVSTAPISDDIAQVRSAIKGISTQFHDVIDDCPGVEEYGDLQYEDDGNTIGILKRCYSCIKEGEWNLLTGYKVGNLVTEWIGQVQSNPQIIGYIEGAPPVPSENLTKLSDFEDYNGCSSVEVEEAENVNYVFSASKEDGFDTSINTKASAGFETEVTAGLGVSTKITDVSASVGVQSSIDFSTGNLNESSVSSGRNTTKTSRLEVRGAWQPVDAAINPNVGQRFVPANVGFALVQSDTMDKFALRLKHNNALVSYSMRVNPKIPKDWNVITFKINDTYTKQGTLDGRIGVKPDGGIQLDPDYSQASSNGQHSYFKPDEAYSLKRQIDREQQELQTYYENFSTKAHNATADSDVPTDFSTRNLANTYVWTSDGGFFSESSAVMETIQESSTGTYSFQGMGGAFADVSSMVGSASVNFEVDALFGGHLETVKSKSKETEKSFSIAVEAEAERDIQLYINTAEEKELYANSTNDGGGVFDKDGKPILRSGKVDAYRFMTFYLEPNRNNFEDFFYKVVDPMWLESSTNPNAIALKQANQSDKKPKCWRVMHRVTFVSRVLPRVEATSAPPVEKAMQSINLQSNFELIKRLEPYIKNRMHDYETLSEAVSQALKRYLPELQPHSDSIIDSVALYFGIPKEGLAEM